MIVASGDVAVVTAVINARRSQGTGAHPLWLVAHLCLARLQSLIADARVPGTWHCRSAVREHLNDDAECLDEAVGSRSTESPQKRCGRSLNAVAQTASVHSNS